MNSASIRRNNRKGIYKTALLPAASTFPRVASGRKRNDLFLVDRSSPRLAAESFEIPLPAITGDAILCRAFVLCTVADEIMMQTPFQTLQDYNPRSGGRGYEKRRQGFFYHLYGAQPLAHT